MKVQDFLEKYIEWYMFEDLKNMAGIKSTHPSGFGEAGYPMMITCLAGIELFGALLSGTSFDPKDIHAGNRYFTYFWNSCLVKIDPYCEDLSPIFRQLLRNGLDHNFFTKPGIIVHKTEDKTNPSAISVDATKKIIVVNSVKFYENLKEAYIRFIRPIGIENKPGLTDQKTMEKRLNEIIDAGAKKSKQEIDKYLNMKDTGSVTRMQRILGISAPPGDMNTPPAINEVQLNVYINSGTVSPGNKKI